MLIVPAEAANSPSTSRANPGRSVALHFLGIEPR